MYSAIEYGVLDGVATITLRRPQARNGYTLTMANELWDALMAPGADAAEGVTPFLQRRAPSFPGTVGKDLPPFLPWT